MAEGISGLEQSDVEARRARGSSSDVSTFPWIYLVQWKRTWPWIHADLRWNPGTTSCSALRPWAGHFLSLGRFLVCKMGLLQGLQICVQTPGAFHVSQGAVPIHMD